MNKHDSSQTYQLSEAHSYSIGATRQLSALAIFLWGSLTIYEVTSLVRAIYAHDMYRLWASLATIFMFCLVGAATLYGATKQRIVVGREGIVYNSGAHILYTPWQNIHKLVLSPHTGEPALQLQKPAEALPIEQGIREERAAIKIRFYGKRPIKIESRYDLYNYIPLPAIKNDIWQDIQQHVPGLDMTLPGSQSTVNSALTRIF
ncbi:hypothetical protein KDA_71200 [Dictyobacter alpinus]|uniref:Uncharacterized protein n=1 Tax=Dictyobacter alpinus TaxID=2014873 RepID=A0A402BJX8_9CHLR|nr:hypothetical protein [Dictyobacter alpinus]GCE31636.1 hypothetical protein KDA_71200 [Dictyobacter alpinus]